MIKVTVNPRQLAAVQAYLEGLPHGALSVVMPAINEYLIGDETHGLKHEAGYEAVSRAEGFPSARGFVDTYNGKPYNVPPGYYSAKQHRYVMGAIARGDITPGVENRNHNLQNSFVTHGDAYRQTISNEAPYAKWVIGNTRQTNMHRIIGWRKTAKNVQDNLKGAFRHAQSVLNKWLKTK